MGIQGPPPEGRTIGATSLLIFRINEISYALHLDRVTSVVRAAAVTPLPKAPDAVLGILDLQGVVVPVFNLRRRFSLPERELLTSDQFIIARAGGRTVALVVDEASEVVDGAGEVVAAGAIHEGAGYLSGVTRTPAGLVLIHDLESFLSLAEEATLKEALQQREG